MTDNPARRGYDPGGDYGGWGSPMPAEYGSLTAFLPPERDADEQGPAARPRRPVGRNNDVKLDGDGATGSAATTERGGLWRRLMGDGKSAPADAERARPQGSGRGAPAAAGAAAAAGLAARSAAPVDRAPTGQRGTAPAERRPAPVDRGLGPAAPADGGRPGAARTPGPSRPPAPTGTRPPAPPEASKRSGVAAPAPGGPPVPAAYSASRLGAPAPTRRGPLDAQARAGWDSAPLPAAATAATGTMAARNRSQTVRSTGGREARRGVRGWAQSRRMVRHLDVWSVTKVSLAFYVLVLVSVVVASVMLWYLADAFGAITSIEKSARTLFSLRSFKLHPSEVAMWTSMGGAVLAVAGTLINVLAAMMYNLISDVVGGVELDVVDEVV